MTSNWGIIAGIAAAVYILFYHNGGMFPMSTTPTVTAAGEGGAAVAAATVPTGFELIKGPYLGFSMWVWIMAAAGWYFMWGKDFFGGSKKRDKMKEEEQEEDSSEDTEEEDDDSEEDEDSEEEVETGEPCMICGEEKAYDSDDDNKDEYYDFGDCEEDVWICKDCVKDRVKPEVQIVEKEIIKTIELPAESVKKSEVEDYYNKVL